jgi:hypothetical protein
MGQSENQPESRKPTSLSPSYDYFQMMFESADLYSSVWQPMMKSVGRWHLEVANLGVRQGQAALQLSRDLARAWTPADALAANMRYLEATTQQYAQSSQRLAVTVSKAVEAQVEFEVVQLPVKRSHDTIMLPGIDPVEHPRKVA